MGIPIPEELLTPLVNRRRRLLRMEREGMPLGFQAKEQELVDDALDHLVSWAEEHLDIFYTEK